VNKATDGQQVINKPEDAVELPHTGGIGTVIFYVLGSILVIGGGIYFISRRRAMK
jgi:LPXTG-motif cell wall-anchored protein